MALETRPPAFTPDLLSTSELARDGMTQRAIAEAVAAGRLVRLRNGWYARGEEWASALPEQRQRAALSAAHGAARDGRVYSHRSAATLHGLPVWSDWMRGERRGGTGGTSAETSIVHALSRPDGGGTSGIRLRLHRSEVRPEEIVRIDGFSCTSADRTLRDIAASEPFPVALACADALLRREAARGRSIDSGRWAAWRDRMLTAALARPGERGVRALRVLARIADPRAESPLESVSRLRAHQLGLEVEPQVPIRSESGGRIYIDFVFHRQRAFGECDGRAKYFDERLRADRSADEVIDAERRRHNWISGVTGLIGVRWGVPSVMSRDRFAQRLREFHIGVPGHATRAFGDETAHFLDSLP